MPIGHEVVPIASAPEVIDALMASTVSVIGWLTRWVFGLGWAILFVTWLWYVYRHVRGLIALVNDEALPR